MTAWRPQNPAQAVDLLCAHARRVAATLDEGGGAPADVAELEAVLGILTDYVAGAEAGLTLDRAWGLRPSSNVPNWWTLKRRAWRNGVLQAAVDSASADAPTPSAAARITLAAVARVERSRSQLHGTDALLADVIEAGARIPRSERGIRNILHYSPLQISTAITQDRFE